MCGFFYHKGCTYQSIKIHEIVTAKNCQYLSFSFRRQHNLVGKTSSAPGIRRRVFSRLCPYQQCNYRVIVEGSGRVQLLPQAFFLGWLFLCRGPSLRRVAGPWTRGDSTSGAVSLGNAYFFLVQAFPWCHQ